MSRCFAYTTEEFKCNLVRLKGHRRNLARKVEWACLGCIKFEMPIKHPLRDAKYIGYTGGIRERDPG